MQQSKAGTRTTVPGVSTTAAAGVMLAILGPFETFSVAPLSERLVYWTAVMLAAYALAWPACRWADALSRKGGLPRLPLWAAAVVVVSIPLTLVVWLASFRHTPQFWPSLPLYLSL